MTSSEILEKFKSSNVWDFENNLPTCPDLNNPYIYMAYAKKLIGNIQQNTFMDFYSQCEVQKGLFNRWPHNRGGLTSHDELIGAAYISADVAKDIVDYLVKNDGIYNNCGDTSEYGDSRFNMYRHYFLMPYLKSAAGYNVSLVSQVIFCAYILSSMFNNEPLGSKLKLWLMMSLMRRFFLVDVMWNIWKIKQKKYGVTLSACFKEELKKYPVYVEVSGDEFF